jgi:N-acetyl-anhydromuramyl-L-alanine amidase AmpD
MRRSACIASIIVCLAACAGEPTAPGLPGERNTALRAAAEHYDVSVDWLAAIAFQQGRFEAAEAEDTTAAALSDPADTLAEDTPLDDTGDPVAVDDAPMGDHPDAPAGWGVMYLSEAQVARAAELTGRAPEAIRTDHGANIAAAAALLAEHGTSAEAVRASTIGLLGLEGDAESAALALADLDDVITEGFDLTTSDGERLVLEGTAPTPETAEAVAPGHYPAIQFIASPNYSTRQGYAIRYIVVHDIEGTMASAIAVFKNSANDASAHYIVRARDGHIVQMVREANNAWHVGHGWFNRHSIGIEHEGFAFKKNGGGYYTDKQYQASARLACAVAHRYNIPVTRSRIFGHFNVPSNLASHTLCSDARGIAGKCGGVSHHSDPGKYWNWTKYMALVRGCVNAAG